MNNRDSGCYKYDGLFSGGKSRYIGARVKKDEKIHRCLKIFLDHDLQRIL
jgi:hypothetical protein